MTMNESYFADHASARILMRTHCYALEADTEPREDVSSRTGHTRV